MTSMLGIKANEIRPFDMLAEGEAVRLIHFGCGVFSPGGGKTVEVLSARESLGPPKADGCRDRPAVRRTGRPRRRMGYRRANASPDVCAPDLRRLLPPHRRSDSALYG
jgi:hypothetical protein